MNLRRPSRALARLATAVAALALLPSAPARAEEAARPAQLHTQRTAVHADDRPGLLLLSFLLPLPLPLALVVSPATSRRPEAARAGGRAPARPAAGARVAAEAEGGPGAAQGASSQRR